MSIELRPHAWLARGHRICVDAEGNPLVIDEHGKASRKLPFKAREPAVVAAVYMHPLDVEELRRLCGEVADDAGLVAGLFPTRRA